MTSHFFLIHTLKVSGLWLSESISLCGGSGLNRGGGHDCGRGGEFIKLSDTRDEESYSQSGGGRRGETREVGEWACHCPFPVWTATPRPPRHASSSSRLPPPPLVTATPLPWRLHYLHLGGPFLVSAAKSSQTASQKKKRSLLSH